jgi:hypothetical protein
MESRTSTYPNGGDLITITTPVYRLGNQHVEDEQHQFVTEHWRGLAASSYQGFKNLGIGVVVVEEPDALAGDRQHPLVSLTVRYAAQGGGWVHEAFGEEVLLWLDEQLQTYDPSEEGLFVFLREDVHPRLYRAGGTPRPPQALRQVKAQLN